MAGESLFMELVSEYKEDMTKFIVNCLQNVQRIPPPCVRKTDEETRK
jgi:hypothetical protein